MTCKETSCDRFARYSSSGLCVGHYRQQKAGRELTPLRSRRPQGACSVRDDQGRKQCITCSYWLVESSFASNPKSLDRLNGECQKCKARKRRATYYQMSPDEIDSLIESQDGACAICLTTDPGNRSWNIDHDHSCCPGAQSCGKCVRGILCAPCNMGLGLFQENPKVLLAAIDYLAK